MKKQPPTATVLSSSPETALPQLRAKYSPFSQIVLLVMYLVTQMSKKRGLLQSIFYVLLILDRKQLICIVFYFISQPQFPSPSSLPSPHHHHHTSPTQFIAPLFSSGNAWLPWISTRHGISRKAYSFGPMVF